MIDFDFKNLLRLSILLGYPLFSLFSTIIIGEQNTTLSIVYRVVVCIYCFFCYFNLKKYKKTNLLYLIFFIFILYTLRLVYDWQVYASDDSQKHIFFFLGIVVIPSVISSLAGLHPQDDEKLAKLCATWGLLFCIGINVSRVLGLTFNRYEQLGGQSSRLELSGLNPISLGYAGYISFFATLIVATKYSDGIKKMFWFSAMLPCMAVIIFSNSRSPILGIFLGMLFVYSKNINRLIPIALSTGFIALIIISFFPDEITNITNRFYKDGELANDESRELLRQLAFDGFINSPVIGSYHVEPVSGSYPHNIFFDTAMSLGILGLAPLIIILINVAIRFINFFGNDYPFISVVLIGMFLGANTSGTLWAYDGLFMTLALCLVANKYGKAHLNNEKI